MKLAIRPKEVKKRKSVVREGVASWLSSRTLKRMRLPLTTRLRTALARYSDVNRFQLGLDQSGAVVTVRFCPRNGVTNLQRKEIPRVVAEAVAGATGLIYSHNIEVAGGTAAMLFNAPVGAFACTSTRRLPSSCYIEKLLGQIPPSNPALVAIERVVYNDEQPPKMHVVWQIRRREHADVAA